MCPFIFVIRVHVAFEHSGLVLFFLTRLIIDISGAVVVAVAVAVVVVVPACLLCSGFGITSGA